MGTFVENVNLVATGIQQVYDNFDEILLADNNAAICTAMAEVCTSTYDQFDDRYLGPKATPPLVDNDGNALVYGTLYFDTTQNFMKVWSNAGWINAGSSVNGTTERYTYTATAGQTVFVATYEAGYIDVFLNGSKLQNGVDFTAVTATDITLTSPASLGDVVDIICYAVFELSTAPTKDVVAYTVNTVADLASVPSSYTTAIVKDLNRGGTFIWSSTGTANGGTVFAGATGYWTRQYSGAVNVKWFGSSALNDISIVNNLLTGTVTLDGSGVTVKGKITIPNLADNITIRNINFIREDGDAPSNFIVVGTYISASDTTANTSNITIDDCSFTTPTDLCNYGDIVVYKKSNNLKILNCNFYGSGDDNLANDFCIATILGSASFEYDFYIDSCTANNRNLLFNNYSTGYLSGGVITKNVMNDCHKSIRLYHLHTVVYSGNTHNNCTGESYLWRGKRVDGNQWVNCGQVGGNAVNLEAPNGLFINNTIENPTYNGVIIVGGNAEGTVSNNIIYVLNSTSGATSGSGIIVDPEAGYEGSPIGLIIQANTIRGMGKHGIEITSDSIIRNLRIKDNIIHACGREGTLLTYSGIDITLSAAGGVDELIIDGNIITKNDAFYGYQDSNLYYDIRIEDTSAFVSSQFWISNNKLLGGDIKFINYKTYGSKSFTNNLCSNRNITISNLGFRTFLGTIVNSGVDNFGTYELVSSGDAVLSGTTTPASGTWNQGDTVNHSSPSAGGFYGWVCTTAGTPGTWKTFGAITA